MPRHDPIPKRPSRPASERLSAWVRFRKLMGWMAVAAVVSVLLALIYLKSSGEPMSINAQIATVLGVGLSVLVGTGLMGLVFLSSASGHDEDVAGFGDGDDERD